ncbi:MAG: helix-turn-helix domain-containing protein [Bacteroidales bacterium]|nr:helix-turn-helix domain-containing protein [Bacteroidales bacterium]
MTRKAMNIQADFETKAILEKWSKSEKIECRLYLRANIILKCLENKTSLEIAQELKISRFTVAKWRLRFSNEGIKGLYDEQRIGKPKKYDYQLMQLV